MKTSRSHNLLILLLILINGTVLAQPGFYPPPSSIMYFSDTLTINPPDSLPGDPVTLLGYNIYVDEEFYGNVMVEEPLDSVDYYLDDESLLPGSRIFCVDAVYSEWISESACDTAFIAYGYELPFYEDWSSGSFETMQWTTDSDHWIINNDDGNPSPSVSFIAAPGLTDYEAVLESYYINAVGIYEDKFWLDFQLTLEAVQSTNNEKLLVQIWNNSSQIWTNVAEYQNENESYIWEQEHLNIIYLARNKVLKIRFLAKGANAADISAWHIDNIHIYRNCDAPTELEIQENQEYNFLSWTAPFDGCIDPWLHWDDEINSGNSIGTGGAVEFEVAARWTSVQLANYNGVPIEKIAFFPNEEYATYRIRIWKGSGPDTMIYDKLVINPLIGQWNYIWVDDTIAIDATQDLWVGYNINAQTGYPAGVDDGPAINGYGNMINFGGWQTLLELNPELNYNWNIAFKIDDESLFYDSNMFYNIYRQMLPGEFELYNQAFHTYYKDENIDLSEIYCYNVTLVYAIYGDTCESGPTNTGCEVLMLGTNIDKIANQLSIYPNPASSVLTIESPDKIKEVRIFNVMGECELKLEIGNSEVQIDVSELENGIYFVEVVTENHNFKDKILVF